jgi:hypothetical protein
VGFSFLTGSFEGKPSAGRLDDADLEYVDVSSDEASEESVATPHVTSRRTNIPGVEMSGALPRPNPYLEQDLATDNDGNALTLARFGEGTSRRRRRSSSGASPVRFQRYRPSLLMDDDYTGCHHNRKDPTFRRANLSDDSCQVEWACVGLPLPHGFLTCRLCRLVMCPECWKHAYPRHSHHLGTEQRDEVRRLGQPDSYREERTRGKLEGGQKRIEH